MTGILDRELAGRLRFLGYRYRFLVAYIVIGVTSIALEIAAYSSLEALGLHPPTSNLLGLTAGILFAYWMNVRFNFRVPAGRRNRAFLYFVGISLLSVALNFSFKHQLEAWGWSYARARFVAAGCLFLLGYWLHRRYSFKDYMKVGVAIYTTDHEDILGIHRKIGPYPDFIHVDVVDDTVVAGAPAPSLHRLEVIRAYWPRKAVHVHLMSRRPDRWIGDLLPFADTLLVQVEAEERLSDCLAQIRAAGKRPGLCVTMASPLEALTPYLPEVDVVMVLAIARAGHSGQPFEAEALARIETLRRWQGRHRFDLCVDGGVNERNVGLLNVEYVVSGSAVLEHGEPHRQIMRLRTRSHYEEVTGTIPVVEEPARADRSREAVSDGARR